VGISYHPNINDIKEKQRVSTQQRWNMKTEKEKLEYAENIKGECNPNWKGGISSLMFECPVCGNKSQLQHKTQKVCAKCRNRNNTNNPFYGKHHSNETKEKIRNKNLFNGNKFSTQNLSVEINGVVYNSFTEAAKELNCAVASIRNRLNNPTKFPTYKLITQP
jgi:hypothetical protein